MIEQSFSFGLKEDFALVCALQSPSSIAGWPISWDLHHRFGGISGLVHKECNSGFSGVSGITVVNSGIGIFSVLVNSQDTSGLNSKNYAQQSSRNLSGANSILFQGFCSLTPTING